MLAICLLEKCLHAISSCVCFGWDSVNRAHLPQCCDEALTQEHSHSCSKLPFMCRILLIDLGRYVKG